MYRNSLPTQEKIGESLGVSRRTIVNHLKYLKESGYLIEDNVNKIYVLPQKEKSFYEVSSDVLDYLKDVIKDPVIKTYLYLGQRNNYKPGEYIFTIKEICEHLGLNYKSSYKSVHNYLIALYKFGLINYTEFYDGTYPKMKLLWVKTECPKKDE